MRKKVTCIMAGFFAMALVFMAFNHAEASPQRLGGMGLQADTYWMIETDTAYIGYNPSHMLNFPSLIAVSPNTADSGESGTLIFATDRETRFMARSANAPGALEPLKIGFAKDLGDMAIGFALGFGMYSADYDTLAVDTNVFPPDATPGEVDETTMAIDLLVGVTMDNMDFAVGLVYYDDDDGTTEESAMSLTVGGRYIMPLTEMSQLNLYGRFGIDMTDNGDDTTDFSLLLGAANQLKLTDRAMAYVGGSIVAGTRFDGDVTFMQGKFSTGAEFALTDSFTGRIGFNRIFMRYTDYDEALVGEGPAGVLHFRDGSVLALGQQDAGDHNITAGLTYSFGHCRLEWVLQYDMLAQPDYFFSGGGGNFSTDFLAVYIFELPGVN